MSFSQCQQARTSPYLAGEDSAVGHNSPFIPDRTSTFALPTLWSKREFLHRLASAVGLLERSYPTLHMHDQVGQFCVIQRIIYELKPNGVELPKETCPKSCSGIRC